MAISYQQKEGNITILGAETSFEGSMEFSDNLIITGDFSGTIKSQKGSLVIEKNGKCKVDSMSADSITIAGKVTGDSYAENRIEMLSGSTVKGNIETKLLRISDNVNFQGNVKMLKDVQNVDVFSVSPSDYKKILSGSAEIEFEEPLDI
ncbi:MAG: hypothetical protein BKP49_09145 [Treponema sp. CETP13]|nr:MAG: hypothetical protein BKP49_09145 [Treponema sp. CETP13]